ncbi:MAG TPA: hypothetical protein DCK79_08055 [Candidatus Atribacteria bacterium]|jgi:hypothetical protein|nr:hypothetical protein [Candidatus Atribacteria bacterium]
MSGRDNIRKKIYQEELNFIKEELKKIDTSIKEITYTDTMNIVEAQMKLWELREEIINKIINSEDFIANH